MELGKWECAKWQPIWAMWSNRHCWRHVVIQHSSIETPALQCMHKRGGGVLISEKFLKKKTIFVGTLHHPSFHPHMAIVRSYIRYDIHYSIQLEIINKVHCVTAWVFREYVCLPSTSHTPCLLGNIAFYDFHKDFVIICVLIPRIRITSFSFQLKQKA